jgi:hypothetical protein
MTDVVSKFMHELQPGDVFADPTGGEPFLTVSSHLVDGRMLSIYALQLDEHNKACDVLMFAPPRETAYLPASYPTEAADDMPSDWWPTDKDES